MWKIINNDCLEAIDELKPPFDIIVADPPYCSGGLLPSQIKGGLKKYIDSTKTEAKKWQKSFDDSMGQLALFRFTRLWLRSVLRIASENAYAFIFTDWRQIPVFSEAFQGSGWTWRGIVPWNKTNARPNHGMFTHLHEYVLYATAGAFSHKHVHKTLECPPPQSVNRIHPTEKPVGVFKFLYQIIDEPAGRAPRVLDMFAGSAAAGEAALDLGFDYVGIELNEYFAQQATERLTNFERRLI